MKLVMQSNALARAAEGAEKWLVMAPDAFLNHTRSAHNTVNGSASLYTWNSTLTQARQNSQDVSDYSVSKCYGSNPNQDNSGFPLTMIQQIHVHGINTGYENTWRAKDVISTVTFPAVGAAVRVESLRVRLANCGYWNYVCGWTGATKVLDDVFWGMPAAYPNDYCNLCLDFTVNGTTVRFYYTMADIAFLNAQFGCTDYQSGNYHYTSGWVQSEPLPDSDLIDLINANKTSPIYLDLYYEWSMKVFSYCHVCDNTLNVADSAISSRLFTIQQPVLVLGVTNL